jgi:hypothetical protein
LDTEIRAPKKGALDADFDGLADALLIRAERAIAELELNDRATQLPHPRLAFPAGKYRDSSSLTLIASQVMLRFLVQASTRPALNSELPGMPDLGTGCCTVFHEGINRTNCRGGYGADASQTGMDRRTAFLGLVLL